MVVSEVLSGAGLITHWPEAGAPFHAVGRCTRSRDLMRFDCQRGLGDIAWFVLLLAGRDIRRGAASSVSPS